MSAVKFSSKFNFKITDGFRKACVTFILLFQVDLEGVGVVTGLKTEGGGSADKTVTAFKVQTGKTACSLSYILEGGSVKVYVCCIFFSMT